MDPSKWEKYVTKGLDPKYDDGVHITGFLGTEVEGKHRIYASLEDRSSYVEVASEAIDVIIADPNSRQVTVTIRAEANIRVVRGDERGPAQFLRGEISSQYMGGAAEPERKGGGIVVFPRTCSKPTGHPPPTTNE